MRIAFLGTRGIPAHYGGFETFVHEVAVRLAARGHEVSVYCRKGNAPPELEVFEGVRLITLPSIYTKHLDTLSHTFFSSLHLTLKGADIAYYCNSINTCFVWMPRLRGIRTIMNTDGLEWERTKWGKAGRFAYRLSAYLTPWFPNLVVADSRVIQQWYRDNHSAESTYVAYGSNLVERGYRQDLLQQFDVKPSEYYLFVSRLEPENNAHLLVKAFEALKTDKKLLVVGGAPFAGEYIRGLQATTDPRISFPGGVYDEPFHALRANAYVYINAMEVGGTHPMILDALAGGNCVLVSDISYNVETIGDAGFTFRNKDVDDLREKMAWLEANPDVVAEYGRKGADRIRASFSWDRVVDTYETLFGELLGGKAR